MKLFLNKFVVLALTFGALVAILPTVLAQVSTTPVIHVRGSSLGDFSGNHETVATVAYSDVAATEYQVQRIVRHDFMVDDKENIYILDPSTSKISLYNASSFLRAIVLPSDSYCEFIAINQSGDIFAYDVSRKPRLIQLNNAGDLIQQQDISTSTVDINWLSDNGLPVGLSADADNVYADTNKQTTYMLMNAGQPATSEDALMVSKGLTRSGFKASAEVASERNVALELKTSDLTKNYTIESDRPVLAVLDTYLDNDKNAYLVMVIGDSKDNPSSAQFCVVSFTLDGTYRGEVDIPSPRAAVRQPVVVSPSGKIYALRASDTGVEITRWALGGM